MIMKNSQAIVREKNFQKNICGSKKLQPNSKETVVFYSMPIKRADVFWNCETKEMACTGSL